MTNTLDHLLDEAEAFAKMRGLTIKTVSNKLFGHGSRIEEYRTRAISPSLKTIEKGFERLNELRSDSVQPQAPEAA